MSAVEEFVISGISGRYPESDNVEQFWQNLMNGVQMCTSDDRRWPVGFMSLPTKSGKLKNIDKFDSEFFKISTSDANYMDPQIRLLHETTYEAIWDAGFHVNHFGGKKTGVFIGLCYSDTDTALKEEDSNAINHLQCEASRLSYAFDFRGPAVVVDTACASMFTAFNEGLISLKKRQCDNLIIAGAAVHLRYMTAAAFKNLRMISDDGLSKCLDARADGYCRSEAVAAVFIQRRSDAKRVYATILGCKTNEDGYKQEGNHFPSIELQSKVMKETIMECGVNADDISYIEAHVTGTTAGDPIECKAILNAYRENSSKPLLFGCLKSNIGHTEGASGGCAITKAVLALQKRCLPPNANFQIANPNIEGLNSGMIVPVMKPMKFECDLIPVNTFGFGGVNVHTILKANERLMDAKSMRVVTDIPRIVAIAGRTQQMIDSVFEFLEKQRENVSRDFLSLVNDVSKASPESGFSFRGFALLDEQRTLLKKCESCTRKQLWFVFSEEAQMMKFSDDLMQINVFEDSLRKSTKMMKAFGYDLSQIKRKKQKKNQSEFMIKTILENTAVKLALIEVFKYLHIIPDGIIGHSMGEILAAFADGCITQQQAILTTLLIAKSKYSENEKQAKKLECIISRITPLKHEAKCKWISTKYNGNIKHCDSSYFMRAISRGNSVKTNELLPLKANIITFGTSLSFSKLNGQLKIAPDISNTEKVTVSKVLEIIGDVYLSGHNPLIENLYPKVRYPVARETASLSPLFKWDHSKKFLVTKYPQYFNPCRSSQVVKIDLSDPKHAYLSGHCLDGRILFPASGYLQLAWTHLASIKNVKNEYETSVTFRNVKFLRAIILPKDGVVVIKVKINTDSGQFFITENESLCASGFVAMGEEKEEMAELHRESTDALELNSKHVYKELRIRGYDYGPSFQCLISAMSDGSAARVKWLGNWTSYIDSLFQLAILAEETRALKVPTYLDYLYCDCTQLLRTLKAQDEVDCIYFGDAKVGFTDGIVVRGMKATPVHRRQAHQIVSSEQHSATRNIDGQSVKLAQQKFTFYSSSIETSNKEMTKIEQFLATCSSLLDKICENRFEVTDEDEKSEFNMNANKEYSFYKTLLSTARKQQNFQTFYENIKEEDKVCIFFESNFKQIIDSQINQIIENVPQKCINLVEFNMTMNKLKEGILQVVDSYILKREFKSLPENKEKQFNINSSNVDVIVYKDVTTELITDAKSIKNNEEVFEFLRSCYDSLAFGGFVLFTFRTMLTTLEKQILAKCFVQIPQLLNKNDVINLALNVNFKLIADRYDDLGTVSLVFKKVEALSKPIVIETCTQNYDWVEEIKFHLKEDKSDRRIWLLSKEEKINGVIGLTKCLKKEPGGQRVRCFVSTETIIPDDVLENDLTMNVFRNGCNGVYIHTEIGDVFKYSKHCYLDVNTRGDLSSFRWFEAPHKNWKSRKQKENKATLVNVNFAALNFKDVMVATGRIPLSAYPQQSNNFGCLGMEYSGTDVNGNRVFGFCSTNAMATTVLVRPEDFSWSVPHDWTLAEAATVPVVYITVYYALLTRAKLRRKETVLIHSGSGGVGQAAIAVCLANGCQVFTSVGSEEKKQFLKLRFPQLQDKHFFNSRESNFEELLMKETHGRGVDVILNSLAEDKLRASLSCLADFGRFVEIGKYDIIQNNSFDTSFVKGNKTFHTVCVAHLMHNIVNNVNATMLTQRSVFNLFEQGLQKGEIKPLNRTVFDAHEVEKAFRFMASGKHVGKVLLKIRDEEACGHIEQSVTLKAIPQTFFDASKVYLVVGGLGGIGLELAIWLAQRGAKKLILSSRSGVKDNYQRYAIRKIEKEGTIVRIVVNDASTFKLAAELIEECLKFGSVGGIFNLAMVLNDALIENQTTETFMKVCRPKVNTTHYLDEISREKCKKLDYFVCFSSAACGRGNAGQSNYGFGNSCMESICERRRDENLHGLAVQWGAVGDVGFVMDNFNLNDIVIAGTVPQRIHSCLQSLDLFLNCPHAVCSSAVVVSNAATQSVNKGDLLKTICHILGVSDPSSLDDNTTLADLGMDSLMAVEIKQGLEREYNIVLTTQEIRTLTVNRIKEISIKKVAAKTSNKGAEEKNENFNPFKFPKDMFTNLDKGNRGVPIFFIPPIEGDFTILQPLVKYISRPVVAIHWTQEANEKHSIKEVAALYVHKLREHYPQTEYEFVSYSFGSLIALEMCIQLQSIESNLAKKLIFLDSNIDEMKSKTSGFIEMLGECDEKRAFEETVIMFLSLFQPFEVVERLQREILLLDSKQEQMQKAIEFINLLSDFNCTQETLTATMRIYFEKMRRVAEYDPSTKFSGTLHFIYSTTQTVQSMSANCAHVDCSIKNYVDGTIQFIAKQGDHKSFLTSNYEDIATFIETEFFQVHF